MEHDLETTGTVRLRTVYLHGELSAELSPAPSVLAVTPLLRELILEALRRKQLTRSNESDLRLARVLVDQAKLTPEAPLELTWPKDPRARRVADRVCADLADPLPLELLALGSGASVRTLERLFQSETGHGFERWRQRVRLMEALRLLATGDSVTTTALAVGFRGTSAFIAMFKRILGKTPGTYFQEPKDG